MNDDECPIYEPLLAVVTAAIGDATRAALWLETPLRIFLGRTPRDTATTEEGWRLVRQVLVRIEYGVYSRSRRW